MKKKLLIFGIAGLLIIGLTGCNNNNLYNDYSNKIKEATSLVKVPIAKENIPKGVIINFDMLEFKELNPNEISEETIIKTSQVLEKTSIIDIKKGDTFTSQNIK